MDRDLKEKSIQIKKEISELKKDLTKVNVEKENWFKIKENLKNEVSSLIKKIKSLRSSKEENNVSIKELKDKRDSYNKEVKELISTYKELSKKKDTISKDKRVKDPMSIKKKIEELELKIETEGLPFEKEQKLMKQIKQLKKEMGEVSEDLKVAESGMKVSKEIDQAKKLAEEYHSKLKDQLGKTSTKYSEFQDLAKQISTLKLKQEEAFKNFIESKNSFSTINETLKIKLMEANKVHDDLRKIKDSTKKANLEQKTKEVEEKLKTKKRLTTEDLLVFQKQKPRK